MRIAAMAASSRRAHGHGRGAAAEVDRDLPRYASLPIRSQRHLRSRPGLRELRAASRHRPAPVVFVSGGGMTGACWESTPDGRPGWLTGFVNAGWPFTGRQRRTRSGGWNCVPGARLPSRCHAALRNAGPSSASDRRRLRHPETVPGSTSPSTHCPSRPADGAALDHTGELEVAALLAVVQRSTLRAGRTQPRGGFAARVAQAAPDTVLATVLLEPHGLPERPTGPQLIVLGDYSTRARDVRLMPVWETYRESAAQSMCWICPASVCAAAATCRWPTPTATRWPR